MGNKCSHFEECSAPLCPMDNQSLEGGLWYVDEEICPLRGQPDWVRKQEKIKRAVADRDPYEVGYFRVEMLERLHRITGMVRGIDPDAPEEDQLEAWLKAHPEVPARPRKANAKQQEALRLGREVLNRVRLFPKKAS